MRWVVAIAALAGIASLLGCQSIAGLGDFAPDDDGGPASTGPSGGGGAGGASSSGGGDPATTGSSSTTSTTTTSTGTGEGCFADHLLLAEVRTRGPAGGNADFVEILNPTDRTITLDASWHLDVRGETAMTYITRWTGDGSLSVGPGQRVLLVNEAEPNSVGGATPDGFYDQGISDGAGILLLQGETVVDAVCFLCAEGALDGEFVCEGDPLVRAGGCGDAVDRSVRRRSVAGVEGCADTGSNATDLEEAEPSTPQGLSD